VRLDDERRARRSADGPAEEHVIAEDEIGRQQVAHRPGIRLDPDLELAARAVLEELDVVALVPVEHEDGKQASDVRSERLRAAEVVLLGVRLLAQDRDVVPRPAPLARELARVHVRARPAEQVSVPDEDPHS
jgi:hypothetical protein